MPDLLQGHEGSIVRMVRSSDGQEFWRLRTFGFPDREAASDFCNEVKRQGVDCFVTRT